MPRSNGRPRRPKAPDGKVRLVAYVTEEAARQLGIALAMEGARKGPWLSAAILERTRRYSVHVLAREEAAA